MLPVGILSTSELTHKSHWSEATASAMRPTPRKLGVLGGMGPLATADFLQKLVVWTPASFDQEHIPTIVYSIPQVPDRTRAILDHNGASPVPAMVEGLSCLERCGVEAITIPCNTAHYWFDELQGKTSVPLLHIVDATLVELGKHGLDADSKVGLLGTVGTLAGGHVQAALEAAGHVLVLPGQSLLEERVMGAITAVKAGRLAEARVHAQASVTALQSAGADVVVLACTELPIALADAVPEVKSGWVDTVEALARYCVSWATDDRS